MQGVIFLLPAVVTLGSISCVAPFSSKTLPGKKAKLPDIYFNPDIATECRQICYTLINHYQ
ncbi:MAG: hypothetical protein EAZ16_03665 [Sphingobacteriales bacterium]|nr:MAG: hypothetical protein EAZ16_03665 [Sphingobacteriales bacterium]